MSTRISLERINVYRNYDGDIDGLLRIGNKSDLDEFGSELDEVWGLIANVSNDIDLIERGLTSKEYAQKAIDRIKSICDQPAFDELTKTIPIAKNSLLDIIKDYQISAGKVVQIFKEKYKVNDILEGWHSGVYEQTGKLTEEGIYFYAFHGIGLAVHYKDKILDFDFAYIPESRHDGFDLWRITEFIQNQHNGYPDYRDKEKIENEFNELIKNGVITNPKLENATGLYFFTNTLHRESIDEINRKTTRNSSQLNKRSLWRKFFGI